MKNNEIRKLIDIIKSKRIVENEEINKEFDLTLNKVLNTIPNEVINKVNEFKLTNKQVIFSLNQYPEINIYIYNNNISKFPTSSINFPKNIYINLDGLSDVPKVVLGDSIGNNIYVNVYYAILHELSHILNKDSYSFIHTDPNNYDKYINSKEEISAMEFADRWLNSFYLKQ